MGEQFVIRTERLILRPPVLADFEEMTAVYGDENVTRYLGGRPFTREEGWARLMRHVGHWQLFGFGFWVMRDRRSGQYVGDVGLAYFRRDIEPTYEDAPEAGWVLAPSGQQQGFATEAAFAAHSWLDEHFKPRRTVCIIQPENAASIRVAEKCGYNEFARSTYKNTPIALFERFIGPRQS
ncbi:MAG TPA: GNAT family N-acetyltransferase [Rhizomicrobium sp.]|jgi:RimJ/RimL family protein N-acetyltransferase